MSALRTEFDLRVEETTQYFELLEKIETDYRVLNTFDKKNSYVITDDLFKILKANGFLLLYNLIESSIFNSVVEIFDELNRTKTPYDLIRTELKLFWLKSKYKNQEKQTNQNQAQKYYYYIEEILHKIPIELAIERLDYGGSIDPKIIREMAVDLGLNFNDNSYKEYPNGKALKKITDTRNWLAHGKHSFSYIGKDLTYNGSSKFFDDNEQIIDFGLVHFKNFTISHLAEYINSVESYILNQEYKK